MHAHIEENDMQDLINLLEKLALTSQEQFKFSLVGDILLSNNDVLPPVALTDLPIVRYIFLLFIIDLSVLNCWCERSSNTGLSLVDMNCAAIKGCFLVKSLFIF
jgi:hypothetical protein